MAVNLSWHKLVRAHQLTVNAEVIADSDVVKSQECIATYANNYDTGVLVVSVELN
jgi:hypothetical protein